jgi:AcrR family transcriptional regulator
LRSDARRNRAQILSIAKRVIAERGFAVPVGHIAKEAGIGVGTIYRHFPTKEALFAAILAERMREMTETVGRFARAEDPAQALRDYLDYMVLRAARDRSFYKGLAKAAGLGLGPSSDLGAELFEAERQVFDRARDAGALRPDLDRADLRALMSGAIAMADHEADHARLVEVICDGLRPGAADRKR